jgi:acetamidase/formamidase
VITGPIYIQNAEPGDMLEVRIVEIELRTPFGVNHTKPGLGVLPDLLPEAIAKVIPFNATKTRALFSEDIEIPLAPFLGIMGVAPPANLGRVSSIPPGAWGGNIDLKQMQKGSTLYLPVFNPGALFFAGDGHAAQGNGEVNLTAIETSLTATLQIILHKNIGQDMPGPRAETPTHYILMGLNPDLNEALKRCVQETVLFLHRQKNLSLADAYSLCSVAIDFEIAEAVDQVQLVYSMVPKSLFKQPSSYWLTDARSDDL